MHKYHTSKEYFWEDMQGKLTSVVALGGKRANRDLSLYLHNHICNFPKSLCISHFFAVAHILPISSSSSSRVNTVTSSMKPSLNASVPGGTISSGVLLYACIWQHMQPLFSAAASFFLLDWSSFEGKDNDLFSVSNTI